jgi:hypothetical protein
MGLAKVRVQREARGFESGPLALVGRGVGMLLAPRLPRSQISVRVAAGNTA